MQEYDIVTMFGINILAGEFIDIMDNGVQYSVHEMLLTDFKTYNANCVFIGFDGEIILYDDAGKILFSGTLLDSIGFKSELLKKIN